MTERDLLRTALIIPPKGRAVLCVWAAVPGVFCAPFVFWQSLFAGCIFCALWACLVFAAWARACSFTAVLTARNTAVRAGIAVPITRQLPRRAVTGVWTLRTPLLWLAGCSVLVVHGPGVQLFLPGVDALQAQQTAAAQAVPAQPLEELQARQTRLTAARSTLREQEQQLAAQLLPNCAAAEKYRTAAEARTQLEQRWQWVSALAATAGGTLTSKQKIKLEAYIQMNYLDRILRHANTRLMQMTAGQYELERIGAENQRSQSGLDLGIIDHYNGTRRSVKTLSGGESFKASLALALGLSDEVQSAAGGIRLDTLFLDEGFGSLDDESLEQAMRVLAGLTEGDRLVGIISHVGALKDRIDRQVVVRKARTGGSTVELIV